MIIGVRRVAGSRRKRRHSSMPLIPGNIRSRIISRGDSRSFNAAASPASPVGAVIAANPSRSKLYFKLSEMSASSSMIRIGRAITQLSMFDKCRFSHVNGQLTNVRHVIADAFEMFGDKQQPRVARRGSGVSHHQLNETMKCMVVQIVDLAIALDDLARGDGIAGRKSIECAA